MLLEDPGRVADTWLNFASAVWFAVTPQTPKPPMTWAIDGTWKPNAVDLGNNMKPGFGSTVYIINGGIECGGGGAEKRQVTNRIAAYKEMARELGVTIPPDEPLGCANMRGFAEGSAGAVKAYLDKDYCTPPRMFCAASKGSATLKRVAVAGINCMRPCAPLREIALARQADSA